MRKRLGGEWPLKAHIQRNHAVRRLRSRDASQASISAMRQYRRRSMMAGLGKRVMALPSRCVRPGGEPCFNVALAPSNPALPENNRVWEHLLPTEPVNCRI